MAHHRPVRRLSQVIFGGAVVLALGLGVATAAPQRPDSGVRGLVLYGPTCPVQRPNHSCERPYQATIVFKGEPSEQTVARAHSGSDGHFSVRLRAGRYEVRPSNGRPYPHASSQTITIKPHAFTRMTIRFDSGIR